MYLIISVEMPEGVIIGCIFLFTARYGAKTERAQTWGRFMSRSLRYLIFYERCHSGRDVSAKKKTGKELAPGFTNVGWIFLKKNYKK